MNAIYTDNHEREETMPSVYSPNDTSLIKKIAHYAIQDGQARYTPEELKQLAKLYHRLGRLEDKKET